MSNEYQIAYKYSAEDCLVSGVKIIAAKNIDSAIDYVLQIFNKKGIIIDELIGRIY